MPFPASQTHRLALPPGAAPSKTLLAALLLALSHQGADRLAQDGPRAVFHVPWTVTFGPLWSITSGELALIAGEAGESLRSRISLRRALIAGIILVLLWAGSELLWMRVELPAALLHAAIIWLWLWGGSYLWVGWRFRRFLRQTLEAMRTGS